ncbi:hypothetical protein H0H92_009662, partial [Tricholoma furcatifolium]
TVRENVETGTEKPSLTREESRLAYCIQRIERHEKKWQTLCGKSSYDYIEPLFQQYLKSGDRDLISNAIPPVESLATRVARYQADILQLAGVGDEYRQAEGVFKNINETVKMLEDLLSAAMTESKAELRRQHANRGFMYQTK